MTFGPLVVISMATVSSAELTMQLPMVTLLLIAHGRSNHQDIELSGWNRVANDVLFEKTITGQQTLKVKGTYADTSRFEFVHRPDLFPPEEIVPKWELAPTSESPPPSRKPAQPNFKKN